MSFPDLFSVDLTVLFACVLVFGLSLLWLYIFMIRGKRERPDLSSLYEKTSHQGGGKRSQKNKGRNKQLEGSPKPVNKNVEQKSSAVVVAAPPQGQVPSKSEGGHGNGKQVGSMKPPPPLASKKQTAKKKSRSIPTESSTGSDKTGGEDQEGEWQTQLSRPQLRALRQKQRQTKETSPSDGQQDSNSDKEVVQKLVGKSRRKLKTKDSNRPPQKPENQVKAKETGVEPTSGQATGTGLIVDGNQKNDGSSGDGNSGSSGFRGDGDERDNGSSDNKRESDSVSPPLPATTYSSNTIDLESALKEAASIVDEDKSASSSETKSSKPQKRKKSRRKKNKGGEEIADKTEAGNVEPEEQDDDDWVIINN